MIDAELDCANVARPGRPAAPEPASAWKVSKSGPFPRGCNRRPSSPLRPAVATVFVESNNPEPGHNAVLAFNRSADGSLTQIGTFSTHGTGQLNLPKVVGPDDSSQEVVATPDGQFLFAVNQGSNTIAAFRIRRDGSLDFIDTFDSGGVQPDSIGIVERQALRLQPRRRHRAGPGGVPPPTPAPSPPTSPASPSTRTARWRRSPTPPSRSRWAPCPRKT